jgi:poly(A) polymerase
MKKAARRIVDKIRSHGHEALFAGGYVRDYLLRRKPNDIDIATSALPEEVIRIFPNARSIGAKYGVIQVSVYGREYEVATFRSDLEYCDGRHPVSVAFSGPKEDALRRDFTINGMFYDPVVDRVIDYVRGRNDINAKLIRTIGDPLHRFSEDKLRMLRAIRLACRLGFTIVPETWSAIEKLAPEILQVSWERIRDELAMIFTGPASADGLELLRASGLLRHILPEVEATCGIPQSSRAMPAVDVFTHTRNAMALLRKPSTTLAFGTLLHDVGKPATLGSEDPESPRKHAQVGGEIAGEICRRLRMSNEDIGRIVDLVATHSDFAKVREMRESTLKRFLRKPDIAENLELHRIDRLSGHKDLDTYWYWLQKLREYRNRPPEVPLLNGEDLISKGYSPGPSFKEILKAIEDMQLEGAIRTREEALAYIEAAFPLKGPAR